MARELLTIFDVAEMTQLSVATVRKYILHREMPFHKIKKNVRFKPDEIEAWIENGGNWPGAAVESDDGQAGL